MPVSGHSPAGNSRERSAQKDGCCAVPLVKRKALGSCRPWAHARSIKCPKTRERFRDDR